MRAHCQVKQFGQAEIGKKVLKTVSLVLGPSRLFKLPVSAGFLKILRPLDKIISMFWRCAVGPDLLRIQFL